MHHHGPNAPSRAETPPRAEHRYRPRHRHGPKNPRHGPTLIGPSHVAGDTAYYGVRFDKTPEFGQVMTSRPATTQLHGKREVSVCRYKLPPRPPNLPRPKAVSQETAEVPRPLAFPRGRFPGKAQDNGPISALSYWITLGRFVGDGLRPEKPRRTRRSFSDFTGLYLVEY